MTILELHHIDALREDHARTHMINCSCTIMDLIETVEFLMPLAGKSSDLAQKQKIKGEINHGVEVAKEQIRRHLVETFENRATDHDDSAVMYYEERKDAAADHQRTAANVLRAAADTIRIARL